MRLSKLRIKLIASTLVSRLQGQGLLEVVGSPENLVRSLEITITDELSLEDRLNAEVRELLKQFDSEFEKGQADYQKMFSMIKSKLVRERGLVLWLI